jgi:hypothetical protein
VIHTHAARISTTVFLVGPSAVTAGTTPSQSAAGVTFGAVEFLVTFHALPGRTGHWTLLADEVTSPSLGTTSLVNHTMIDVNADGTIEATSPSGPVSVPLVIPASGSLVVKVSVENHGASTGFLYSSTQTDIRMNLDPINGFGFACGGATSVGTVGAMVPTTGWSTFTLSSSGGFPNMPTLSVFGTQTAGPLLPGGCGLFTDPMIVVPFLADAAGAAVHTFDVHATHYGTLYHQFLPLDLATFTFRSSNGLRIICW